MSSSARDDGAVTVELLFMVPILVLAVVLVVAVGRSTYTDVQVNGAAGPAARSAALARTPGYGQVAAQDAATTALSAVTCAGGPQVSVDSARFQPGGDVSVTLTCEVSYTDLGLPGLPGSRIYTASAASPIETYRGVRR